MNTNHTTQKPGLVTAIAFMTLASGITNLFWGYVASASVLSTVIGVVCLPITILPTILGIFEIIYAAQLLSNQPQPMQPSQRIAVFQILMLFYFNIFSMIVGILTIVFYNDQSVRQYFAHINGTVTMPPAPVPAPVIFTPMIEQRMEEVPAPAEPITPEEIPAPVEEAPAKPKRTRKVAGK